MDEVNRLKEVVKGWENNFLRILKKKPDKDDLKRAPREIRKAYVAYYRSKIDVLKPISNVIVSKDKTHKLENWAFVPKNIVDSFRTYENNEKENKIMKKFSSKLKKFSSSSQLPNEDISKIESNKKVVLKPSTKADKIDGYESIYETRHSPRNINKLLNYPKILYNFEENYNCNTLPSRSFKIRSEVACIPKNCQPLFESRLINLLNASNDDNQKYNKNKEAQSPLLFNDEISNTIHTTSILQPKKKFTPLVDERLKQVKKLTSIKVGKQMPENYRRIDLKHKNYCKQKKKIFNKKYKYKGNFNNKYR